MERRSFLRGVFGGLTTGGLILAAKPKDLEAFAAPLVPEQPLIIDPYQPQPHIGEYLYNELGERVAIIQSIEAHRDVEMNASWGDSHMTAYPGLLDVRIRAIGIGGLAFESVTNRRNRFAPPYRLRGQK